jgi:crossover junction endodeoxyribonuclease RusA
MRKDVSFTVPGDPVVKGRPRFTRQGRAYTPKATSDAERRVKDIAREVFLDGPFTGPVGIDLVFYCKTKRRSDGDNMCKLLVDALNEVAYTDDYLIEEWRIRIYRRLEGEEPRTEVTVYSLEGMD